MADVIVTAQLNDRPGATIAPQVVIDPPVPIVVVIVAPGVNPIPEIVTEVPLGPWFGVSVIAGFTTVVLELLGADVVVVGLVAESVNWISK